MTSTSSSGPGSPARPSATPRRLKRLVLRTAAWLSPRSRRLGLTDTNNGLRVFNKTVADGLDITMNGMSHANEFIKLIAENHWRVAEEPVEMLYTEYSKSKGQPLLNGVNIIFDGFLRGRIRTVNWIQVLLIGSIVALLVYLLRSRSNARSKAWVKVGYVVVRARRHLRGPAARRHHGGGATGSGCAAAPT